MSSTQVQRPINAGEKAISHGRVQSKDQERPGQRRSSTFNPGINATKKNNNDGRFKFGRKRAQSFTTGNGKFFPPYKRRKKEGIIPPTKFLLGGNIYDPLNLNSLQDEEINRAMNAVTPKSSPLPTPKHRKGEVEVIIPPNINDPLNLIDCDDDAKYEEQLVSPTKKGRSRKNRKKKRNSSSGGSTKDDSIEGAASGIAVEDRTQVEEGKDDVETKGCESAPAVNIENSVGKEVRDLSKVLDLPLMKDKEKKPRKLAEDCAKEIKRNRKIDLKDKIVSPVIPQPGAWKRPLHGHRGGSNNAHGSAPDGRYNRFRPGGHGQQKVGQLPPQTPKFQAKNERYQYGNYNRYYGYRNGSHEGDVRLRCFSEHRDLFYDKDVLDIGCNIGHITLSVARDFGARSVVGLDIDRSLIDIARKNIRHYVNCAESPPNSEASERTRTGGKFFPISMPILYGPVDVPGMGKGESPSLRKKFPRNVTFVQGNYVLESDTLLLTEQPQFDVILCLSITKWLHLNWGDTGLKQAFGRMFAQLRPGGKLILEAQAWESYKRKKNLTETIYKNYNSIEFKPQKFTQYLLSSEVGFSKCEVIGTPYHQARGFQRPIQLFSKGESPSHSTTSSTNTPSYATTVTKAPIYTAVVGSGRSDTNTPSYVADTNVSRAPVYTAAVVGLGSSRDAESLGSANPSSYVEDGSIAKVPVYATVTNSNRDVEEGSVVTLSMETGSSDPSHQPEVMTAASKVQCLQDSNIDGSLKLNNCSVTETSIDVDVVSSKTNISLTANASVEPNGGLISGDKELMEVDSVSETDSVTDRELGSQNDRGGLTRVSGDSTLEDVDTRQTLALTSELNVGLDEGTVKDQSEAPAPADVCDIVNDSTS